MKKDLKSIRLIRFFLIAISSVVFLIGIYQHRSAFMKGWNETPGIDGPHSGFHAAIFKNVIRKEEDSLQISGQAGIGLNWKRNTWLQEMFLAKSKAAVRFFYIKYQPSY